jgi:hypothetical protein
MSAPAHLGRRQLLIGALSTQLPLGACTMSDKPVLRAGVGQRAEEIAKNSTLRPLQTGAVSTPHRIEYKDHRLELTLPDCGAQISMPTTISISEDRLEQIGSASVLTDYVDIRQAVHHVGLRLNEVLAQGFEWLPDSYARFASLGEASPIGTAVPASVKSLDEVVDYFTNPQWLVKEINAFRLLKEGLEVGLRLRNMRRSFPHMNGSWQQTPDQVAAAIDRQMTHDERLDEKAYYLEMSFAKEFPRASPK